MLSCPGEDPLCNGCAQADRPLGFHSQAVVADPQSALGVWYRQLNRRERMPRAAPKTPQGFVPGADRRRMQSPELKHTSSHPTPLIDKSRVFNLLGCSGISAACGLWRKSRAFTARGTAHLPFARRVPASIDRQRFAGQQRYGELPQRSRESPAEQPSWWQIRGGQGG
jgi:hypothetical protein